MKLSKITLALVVIALTAVSCVEKSGKYQTLLAQRDSLLVVDQSYHQTLDILNEVETGFQSIRDTETVIYAQISNAEGQPASKKQQLAGQITQIKEILAQNKAKIAELQRQLSFNGKKNRALAETIERLNTELAEKATAIENMQAELVKKNIKIEELSGTITGLNTDITNLNEESTTQKATIAAQDADMNKVAYIVGTAKELKALNILSGNGLFRAKSVMDKDFDKAAFAQTDMRSLNTIATGSKKPKLLSSHPQDSYQLVAGDDKMVSIEISDPAKFWSVSKYLVIQK